MNTSMNTSIAGGFFYSLTASPSANLFGTMEHNLKIPEDIIINITANPDFRGHQDDQPEVLEREYSSFLKQANLIVELNKKHE